MTSASGSSDFGKAYFDRLGSVAPYTLPCVLPYFETQASRIKTLLHPKRVLDLGCAKGFLVLAFRKIGIESYGVDVSEYALSEAPQEVKPFLCLADLNCDDLPFDDHSFDLIVATGVLEYLHNDAHAISEVKRLMTKDGTFLLEQDFTRPKTDKLRINVHGRGFWIRRLESNDFVYMTQISRHMLSLYARERLERELKTKRWFRPAKLISRIPRIGKWVLIKSIEQVYGILFFKRASGIP